MSFFEAMFGDDFPDAFPHDGRSCKSQKTMLDLPAELLEIICRHLSKLDIKRLRLTSRDLAEKVELRVDRVYVSPNRANLDCLNSILNHPRYYLEVQEIVWDDAQLEELPTFDMFRDRIETDQAKARIVLENHLSTLFRSNTEDETEYKSIGAQDCIQDDGELTDIGKAMLLNANDEKSKNIIASRAASMSMEDSYILYQKLYQDERGIVKREWDVDALRRALEQLPNLKRITITSEAWRPWNLVPTYDTPFHRALPAGFRKPSVWPWVHGSNRGASGMFVPHLPADWRGYGIVMSVLASKPVLGLEELILDTGREYIGLPAELFLSANRDCTNSIRALSTTSLKKLQLSIMEFSIRTHEISTNTDQNGLLKGMISSAPNLEHLDLKWSPLPSSHPIAREPFGAELLRAHCPGLKTIALRHAGVRTEWLYNVITSLEKLEHVTLERVRLVEGTADTDYVFCLLQQHYAGRCSRGPRFTWIDYLGSYRTRRIARGGVSDWLVVLESELNAFLYDGGEIPITWVEQDQPYRRRDCVAFKPGVGWIMDARDPTVRIPNSAESVATVLATMNPWPLAN